jgi:hypothetical protein
MFLPSEFFTRFVTGCDCGFMEDCMSYAIHWHSHGVFVDYFDPVSRDDFDGVYHEIMSSVRYDELHYIINSLLNVTLLEFSVADIERRIPYVKAMSKSNRHIRCAVVSEDEGILTAASFFQSEMRGSPWECQFFTYLDEAKDWVCAYNPKIREDFVLSAENSVHRRSRIPPNAGIHKPRPV